MLRDRVSQQTPNYARRAGDIGGEALKIIDSLMLQCSETIIKSISQFISIDPEQTRSNVKLQLCFQSLGGTSNLP